MSLTPPLCAMLNDELLRERYLKYLDRAIALAKSEIDRTQYQTEINHLARIYYSRFLECREIYVDRLNCDLVKAFKRYQDGGFLEIITCGATHGFLPLMEQFPEAVRAQNQIACDDYEINGGRKARGLWLADCAYYSGFETYLQQAELRGVVLDAHG
jgi:1,4-alpha-glucan branching enzyme